MKELLIAASLLPLALVACKKKKLNDPIIGKWELVQTSGMMGIVTPAQTGHTRSLNFSSNYIAVVTQDGASSKFAFSVKQEKNVNVLSLPGSYIDGQTISYKGDTLLLSGNIAVDGTIDWYTRQ